MIFQIFYRRINTTSGPKSFAGVKINNRLYDIKDLTCHASLFARYGCGCGSGIDHKPAFYLEGKATDFTYDEKENKMVIT